MDKRVIFITGASTGIGRASADQLERSGWQVIGASRREVTGVAWQHRRVDVDDDASVKSAIDATYEEYGRLDAVLHCAGWGLAGAAEQTSIEAGKAQLETNFWGAVRVANAAIPIFRSNAGGRLVFISSIGGLIALPFQAFYSASKFALEGYAEALSYEVAPHGVKVTLIEPGNFKTAFTQSRRMINGPQPDVYAKARDRAISQMAHDEEHGADPRSVAQSVENVLSIAKPPIRVSVGKVDERIGLVAKRLLPFSVFQRAARSSLGV
ncbi:MAG: SDR family oxidoreductase [Acidimicrobiaceae bacterium]|nr:SDR family oxidoreductase [Acidimicrobiaceae bacterium]